MVALPPELRALVETGPLVHLTTINTDGSPQVSMIWVGLDGDDLVSGHLGHYAKVRNVERDPRVVLSFLTPPTPGLFLAEHAVLTATAAVEAGDDAPWELLDRLTKVYLGSDETFPAPRKPGFVLRYGVERIGGVGPWASTAR